MVSLPTPYCVWIAVCSISRIALLLKATRNFIHVASTVRFARNNVRHSIDQIQADQRNYARTLSSVVARYMPGRGTGRLLDVGGSTGIVTSEFVKKFSLLIIS